MTVAVARCAPSLNTTLDAELALLRRAHGELNRGAAGEALDLLDEHALRFPHGALEQSREVTRVLALCAAGRTAAAQVRAQSFLARFPDSPLAGRVRHGCAPKAIKHAVPTQ